MRRALVGALLAAAWCAAATPVLAQREFQFFVQFSDAAGGAVTTLTEADIQVSEDGTNGKVLKLEPVDWPVRVAILLDNGTGSADRIVNVRQGTKGLIEALPAGVEISLQTLAPQPRWLVRPTTDKQALLEGVDRYSPDSSASRFVDGLTETVARFDKERGNNFPVVVILGSLTADGSAIRDRDVKQLFERLASRAITVQAITPAGAWVPLLRLRTPRPEWRRRYWLAQTVDLPAGSRIEVTTTSPSAYIELTGAQFMKTYPLQVALDFVAAGP